MLKMKVKNVKEKIFNAIDESRMRESKVSRLINYLILFLIFFSTIETIEGQVIGDVIGKRTLTFIDSLIYLLFSVEFMVRFWVCDVLDEKYRGVSGRLKYLFSFYPLIDLFAIMPFYIGLFLGGSTFVSLRVLRVLRVLRLVRYLSSFAIIVNAIKSKKSELLISMQVVLMLTFILSVLMFQVENVAQPKNFGTVWDSFLWSLSKFIGGIAGYGDFSPVTQVGMVLGTFVGVLGIAIFAIPAGIIASGFVDEIGEARKSLELDNRIRLLVSSFIIVKPNYILGIPIEARYKSMPMLQSKLAFTEGEIFESVRRSKNLRIKFEKSDSSLKTFDMVVLEHFNINTLYGEMLPRNSNIHIINPIGRGERAISHFTRTLAAYGGFNSVTNEMFSSAEIHEEYKCAFDINQAFNDKQVIVPLAFKNFCKDIKNTVKKSDWVIIVRSAASRKANQLHCLYGGEKGDVCWDDVKDPTVSDRTNFEKFEASLRDNFCNASRSMGTHEDFKCTSPNLLHQYIRKETSANVITLFISINELSTEKNPYFKLIKAVGDAISELKSES